MSLCRPLQSESRCGPLRCPDLVLILGVPVCTRFEELSNLLHSSRVRLRFSSSRTSAALSPRSNNQGYGATSKDPVGAEERRSGPDGNEQGTSANGTETLASFCSQAGHNRRHNPPIDTALCRASVLVVSCRVVSRPCLGFIPSSIDPSTTHRLVIHHSAFPPFLSSQSLFTFSSLSNTPIQSQSFLLL
jgi:hypothetical protein